MSIQRPTVAQDPYHRPATVAYGAQQVVQSGFAPPAPQQAQHGWVQQPQQQAPAASYNPNQYPPMPGAAAQPMMHQQQQLQQQQQSPSYNQQGYGSVPLPLSNRPSDQQTQHQHRWSVAGQIPAQAVSQSYQQHPNRQSQYINGSAGLQPSVEQYGAGGLAQTSAPLPPPKDNFHGQHSYQQPPQPNQYSQAPTSAPPQNYQYAAGNPLHQPYDQQYAAYSNPVNAATYSQVPITTPVPLSTPHQSFQSPPPPQAHLLTQQSQQPQGYGQYHQISQPHTSMQQWSSNTQQPQVFQSQPPPPPPPPQQQQQQQPHQVYSHVSQTSLSNAQAPHARYDEPVSPITAGRQSGNVPHGSRPTSNHLPSRSNSNLSRQHDSNVVSHTQHITRQDSSPISAMKASSSAFTPKRKVMDANGVGATGSTALGLGGPSDWENFGHAEFEVDDLDYYSGKQEPKGVTKVKEGKIDGEPVELPAGSPSDDHDQQPWQSGAVEMDSGSPISTWSASLTQQAPVMHPTATGQAMAESMNDPVTSTAYVIPQHNNQHVIYNSEVATAQLQAHRSENQPSENSSDPSSSGWRPSPQMLQSSVTATENQSHHQQYIMSQQGPSTMVETGRPAVGRPSSQGSWGVPQQAQAPLHQISRGEDLSNVSAIPNQPAMAIQVPSASAHGVLTSTLSPRSAGASNNEMSALQRKLTQTESELAQIKDREMENRLDGEKAAEQLQMLNDRIAQLEDECRMAQGECVKLENNLEAMESASVAASNERSEIETDRNNLLTEKATWNTERTDLAMKIGEAEGALSKMKAEKAGWDSERSILTAKLAESQAFVNLTNSERAKWTTERDDLTAKLLQAEAALANARAESNGTRTDLLAKVALAENALLIARNDAEATSTGYQAKLKEANEKSVQIQSDLDVVKKQYDDLNAKPVDIAPGLGEWYKGSLTRFAETLFGEEAASSIPDKMHKFQDWVNAEAQLRGIEMSFQPRQTANVTEKNVVVPAPASAAKQGSQAKGPLTPKLQTDQADASILSDDIQYSPGGRPIMRRTVTDTRSISDVSVTSRSDTPPFAGAQVDKKAFRAYRADSVPSHGHDSYSKPLPVVESVKPNLLDKILVPAIKPLAYQKPKFVKPVEDTSVPALKSASSVPLLSNKTNPVSLLPKDEIFFHATPGTEKAKTSNTVIDNALPVGLKPKTPAPFAQAATSIGLSPPVAPAVDSSTLARKASGLSPLDQLKDILPRVAMPSVPMSHQQVTPVSNALSLFADSDFSFIAVISSRWETAAAEKRQRLDTERARRQAEAEERSSELFQEGAIGYGDIGEMEGINKEKELERQEQETNEEWTGYLKDVFGIVFERLQKEIEELIRLRADVDALTQIGAAGQQALDAAARPDAPDRAVVLADTLSLLIRVHTLLVAREVEADKVVVERDTRYKKNITRSLYRKGQIKKMKEQELHFEKLERKSEVERRRERLKNCGLLMKDIKAAVGRGCDENEAFAAEVLAITRKVALDDSLGPRKSEVQTAIRRASDVLTELAQSSTALMRHYERVDSLLNDAEYEHQVAVERASDAAPTVFHDLEAQKREQDRLLTVEARQRESAVDKTLQEWRADLGKITAVMGLDDASVGASAAGGVVGEGEEEKKKRLQAALEIAKRRNGDL